MVALLVANCSCQVWLFAEFTQLHVEGIRELYRCTEIVGKDNSVVTCIGWMMVRFPSKH